MLEYSNFPCSCCIVPCRKTIPGQFLLPWSIPNRMMTYQTIPPQIISALITVLYICENRTSLTDSLGSFLVQMEACPNSCRLNGPCSNGPRLFPPYEMFISQSENACSFVLCSYSPVLSSLCTTDVLSNHPGYNSRNHVVPAALPGSKGRLVPATNIPCYM
jgi:hypothetical protein